MSTNRDLKAYIRIDGSGRDVAGSLVLRTKMPTNGKWRQVLASQCCNPVVTPTTTTTTTQAIVITEGEIGSLTGGDSNICYAIQFFGTVYMGLATPNVIAIGDILYLDAAGTNPYPGNGTGWKAVRVTPGPLSPSFAVVIDANGVVLNSSPC